MLDAARRREIDVVLVWRLDRCGRSVADLVATLQELSHLGVGFVSLTEALDLNRASHGRSAGRIRRVRARDPAREGSRRIGSCPAEGEAPRATAYRGAKSRPRCGNCIAMASVRRRSRGDSISDAPRSAVFCEKGFDHDQPTHGVPQDLDKRVYVLSGNMAGVKPGDRLKLQGKKVKPTGSEKTLGWEATKVAKDFGVCQPQP